MWNTKGQHLKLQVWSAQCESETVVEYCVLDFRRACLLPEAWWLLSLTGSWTGWIAATNSKRGAGPATTDLTNYVIFWAFPYMWHICSICIHVHCTCSCTHVHHNCTKDTFFCWWNPAPSIDLMINPLLANATWLLKSKIRVISFAILLVLGTKLVHHCTIG